MYEVSEVCDRVMFLSRGKILMEGEPEALVREHGAASLEDLFIEVAHEGLGNGSHAA
jgi:ABC-2 type transport system ATP-binding protein